LKIINPNYSVNPEKNLYTIRRTEFSTMLERAREIVSPAEELGFSVTQLELKDARVSHGELFRTVKQNLIIKLKKGASEIDLSMGIPKLLDGNFVIINGRQKIPQFQLFDIPIVTRGKSIKLRTNVASMVIMENKEEPYVSISLLGRKVPLCLVMFAYYGMEKLNEMYNFDNLTIAGASLYDKLIHDLKVTYEASTDYTQDDFIKEVGRFYSKYSPKVKGEDLVYALDLMLKTDIFATKFFTTESVLTEIVEVLKDPSKYDDTDFRNKRIRCVEYMVLSKVSKAVFDLCMSNRTSRQPKFNINAKQILTECNTSDIVQFNFAINPIDEITKLSRATLIGPGGFNRENIPEYLRDITPSMFGRVCPVDTPDRENCGVLQNLLPNVKLDENLRFSEEFLQHPISAPVSMTPFCEHDDQTRLQMSASQMRQSIMLKRFEQPMVKSGCEGLYTDFTQFVKRAQKDGEVVFVGNGMIIAKYDDNTTEIFDVSHRRIYVENMDVYKVYVQTGDKFKAGDILAESNFCEDGEIVFGRNLLTAVMVHYGNNYEDGIIISDRLVKSGDFTSIHFKDMSFNLSPNKVLLSLTEEEYKPLPNTYDRISVGDHYAIIKELPESVTDYFTVFKEELKLTSKKNMQIVDVNIYANSWNTDIPEFCDWIESKIDKQRDDEANLRKVVENFLTKEESASYIRDKDLSKFSQQGKYKIKHDLINGMHIEIVGIHQRQIRPGDKIANRHGNKGVISRILEEEKMPKLEDGRHVDICINHLGIISRMNVGQLFEAHLSMSLYDLKKQLREMISDNKSQDEIKKYLTDYIDIVDNTKDGWYSRQFQEQLPEEISLEFVDDLTLIQAPFESVTMDLTNQAMDYTNTPFEYKVYEPLAQDYLLNPVTVGYIYFFRMVHIAEERLAARGIGSYTKRTLQPLAGRKFRGGQRCGEMETACMIAHDGIENLFEMLTTKSDCITLKNDYIKAAIDIDPVISEDVTSDEIIPESVKLLHSYLTVIGIAKD